VSPAQRGARGPVRSSCAQPVGLSGETRSPETRGHGRASEAFARPRAVGPREHMDGWRIGRPSLVHPATRNTIIGVDVRLLIARRRRWTNSRSTRPPSLAGLAAVLRWRPLYVLPSAQAGVRDSRHRISRSERSPTNEAR
jgi:hypothetical protein